MNLTRLNCAYHARLADGALKGIYRFRSEGFSAVVDRTFEEIAEQAGCRITRTAESHTVGTIAAPLYEHQYTTPDGRTMYAYVLLFDGGDTWCQEWITSAQPITSAEAAALIDEGRDIAHGAEPLTAAEAAAIGARPTPRVPAEVRT
jgi:hypothetical protein